MTELPDFTGYEPVELSQVKQGDVVAAVFAGTIAHGAVTYATKYGLDLDSGFCATDKTDYKLFKAPQSLPTGECAVIEYTFNTDPFRAILMGGDWFRFGVWAVNSGNTSWDAATDMQTPAALATEVKDGFTVIFEGVKK